VRGRIAEAVIYLGVLTTLAAAEQPDWDQTANMLLAVRAHDFDTGQAYMGIWTFDPDSASWKRLGHFSCDAVPVDTWVPGLDEGCLLSAGGAVVFAQAWPANLELEVGSYRVLRRTSPVADPAAVGWAVQGAVVSDAAAVDLGLLPGTFGIARCFGELLPHDPLAFPDCPAYVLPGSGVPVECTDSAPWPLLRRDEASRLDLAGLLPPLDWYPSWPGYTKAVPTLSLDRGRRAFWRGTPRGLEVIPIQGGGVGPPSLTETFEFPPFDDPEFQLELLYYHPRRDQLFLRTGSHLMTLSPSLDVLADRDLHPGWGWPVALTSLGEMPATYEQLLPIVAHTAGRNDTVWTSDLWLYNPSGEDAVAFLRRVTAPAEIHTVGVPAHGSVRIPDALAFLGGGPFGDGAGHDAVVLESAYRWGEQVVAASRTFTAAPGGGSYGHTVTASPGRAGYSNHLVYPGEPEPDWAYQVAFNVAYAGASTLYGDRRVPGQFRHNLGVVNDFDEPVRLTLLWGHMENGEHFYPEDMGARPSGALQTLEIAPHSVRVVQLDALFPAEVVELWPPRIGVWGNRPAALWFSMVDNLTGDATFVPYTALHWGTDLWTGDNRDVRAAVPVVVDAPGEGEALWRTDLYGADGLLIGYAPMAWLHPSRPASDCGGAAAAGEIRQVLWGEVAQPPGVWPGGWGNWGTVHPDVARRFSPCAGDQELHAGLELMAGTWQIGWTRTYTTRDDGGTYGDMLPFYPLGGWPVQHFAGVEVGAQFRVNVGLFNGNGEHPITHRITLYAADGRLAAERTVTLQPYASLQRRLEHLFRMESGSLPAGTYGMTVLPLDDPVHGVEGRSWAWVSLVDNVTGDPTNWW
jgi:hypothetical protein